MESNFSSEKKSIAEATESDVISWMARPPKVTDLASFRNREPSQAELADFMGKDIESFQKERAHAHRFQTVSLESQLPELVDLPTGEINEPEAQVAEEQFMDSLVESIEMLPERERTVISLYYVEEMNLKEIGAVLDVSESRVSQIISSSVKKLRRHLEVSEY